MARGCSGGDPLGKAIDLTQVVDLLSLIAFQQVNLILVKEETRVRKIHDQYKQIDQLKAIAFKKQLSHAKSITFEVLKCSFGVIAIALWLFIGALVGVIASHNLLSTGVQCDSNVCEILRFDGNTVKK